MKIKQDVKIILIFQVVKLREIFTKINELKYSLVNVIVKIISAELLIKKQNINLILLKVVGADESGIIHMIMKNELIKYAKINKELIIRNAKLEEIDGYVYIVCDEICDVFESSSILNISGDNLGVNFSEIKINKFDNEIF